ncbi:hypothetical protein SRIMM317S_06537 [Streptomyces rimosus subsp. rimosus]
MEAVAPWLTIDGDAYPAVIDGRIKWIVDAYTTSNGYPYASRTTLGDTTADSLTDGQRAVVAQQNQVNYIRNSVKATVDAYDGSVKLYEWDTKDPVLKTWMKSFPGTVEKKSSISKSLMEHMRYPQDLFKVQRQLLTTYHVTDPNTFYTGSERWQVPNDPTNKSGNSVPPYYQSLKMPDQKAQTFALTTTFTPNKRDNLGAFMAVDANATSADYGKIRVLKLPSQTPVPGPQQVQSKFNSDPKIANELNILKKLGDSEIEYGNLLTVPMNGGLLYVEPVYLRGAGTNYPLLKKVLVSYGENDPVLGNNLAEALDVVFGKKPPGSGNQNPPGGGDTGQQPPADQTVQQALDDAVKAYEDGEKARRDGDWGGYGEAQKKLKAALDRAAEAEKKAQKGNTGKNGG